jgi:hypothetical protein
MTDEQAFAIAEKLFEARMLIDNIDITAFGWVLAGGVEGTWQKHETNEADLWLKGLGKKWG